MELKKKVEKQREVIRNKIYPFLVENSESIEDAKLFVNAVAVVIKQQFTNRMTTTNVSDLKLKELGADAELVKRYNAMFDILADYTITDALTMIEGMPQEIDSSIREENSKRKLADLKVQLL